MNIRPGGSGGWTSEQQKQNAIKSNQKQKWLMENDKEWASNRLEQLQKNGSNVFTKLWEAGKLKPLDWTGKKHKEDSKKKIGEANSVKQKGEANSQFGTRWITNGSENKKIKKEQPIPTGWKFGRS
jgi:hypothetical protein